MTHRSKEGYLLIDNRAGGGVSDELVRAAGLPAGANKGLFECPTYTCAHCSAVVIINPDRKRERAYCAKCDHRICDDCGAAMAVSRTCVPIAKILDDAQENAALDEQRGTILLPGGSK